jgi:glucose/arabinose dehydrogenase
VRWIAVSVTVTLAGCLPASDELPPPIDVAQGLRAEYLVAEALHPSALATAADGRVFYTEKDTGAIRVIKDGTLLEQPLATVPVNSAGQRGLLGVALHPRFEDNGRVYVFYTRSDTGLSTSDPQAVIDHRVVYFQVQGDVSGTGEIFVLSLPAGTSTERIGGRIAFAPDRTLWVALGDCLDAEAAQGGDFPYGKILRYNDDGTIPETNPTAGSPIYAVGLREPRGLAFDPQTDAGFVTERSAGGLHEVNRILRGKNYGWPQVVGWADTAAEQEFAAQNGDYADPITESTRALIGASFNPSTKYGPDARLQLFYGVSDAGRVLRLELSAERTAAVATKLFAAGLPTPVTDVAFTPAGTLYVACENAVFRIVPVP